jgi:cephalosporin hydroxylase
MISDEYHIEYEEKRVWEKNTWLGIPCWKLPMDAFVIQELIYKLKPDFIIETGTGHGGSALFYASICELMDHGEVISIDIDTKKLLSNRWGEFEWADRIHWLMGDSLNSFVLSEVKDIIEDKESPDCLVLLDSWHSKEHVYREMLIYSQYVNSGGYMIIEDSHAAGNPVPWEHDDEGPMGAINQWMNTYGDKWEIDYECEKNLMTFNPKGYLKRK